MTVCMRQPPDSVAINQQITRLPLCLFTLPPRHFPPLQEGDSSPTNQGTTNNNSPRTSPGS